MVALKNGAKHEQMSVRVPRLILLIEKTFRMSNCWVVVLDPDLTAAFSLLRTRPFILLRLPLVDNP